MSVFDEDAGEEGDLYGQLFCVNLSRSQNLNKVTVLLNGVNVTLEIDMGASTTVVDEKTFNSRVEEQGWCSGDCTHLGVWATSGLSWLLVLYSAPRGFSPGFSGFPLSSKINISKFQFDRMQDLPENHF